MKDADKAARQQAIETAAYALLSEKGFAGCSMLSVAKRARCSNETLYNWYGDKLGLMRSLVARNAQDARQLLEKALQAEAALYPALQQFGPVLLGVVLSDRAVALNRAAAADPTGALGAALAEAGRDTVQPLLRALFDQARAQIKGMDPGAASDLYLSLLIGDLQIRRAIGRLPMPSELEMQARADRALWALQKLV